MRCCDQRSHLLSPKKFSRKRRLPGPSLVVQWLRIRLPTQGTRFDPWSGKIPHAAEREARVPQLLRLRAGGGAATSDARVLWSPRPATSEGTAGAEPRTAAKRSPRSPQLEKARMRQRRPARPKLSSVQPLSRVRLFAAKNK
ncbi:hypothetical protein MG293_016993 [Ovis ammon polii]|uniref:Uncharacterized protein n=1 Tax=Ovis ammon polii TaxID=230172 RepID=A0AAD4TXB6_OVIAM|nr:hypothetical protein MG293_016993 [Ovis ammon polii]KAI4556760.1 hypothetical protein MJT46_015383 [Ovis ammon polii x Ovis aries]